MISFITRWKLIILVVITFLTYQTQAQSPTVAYIYDNVYRLSEVNYSNGSSITYSYDASGNRLSVKVTGVVVQVNIAGVAIVTVGAVVTPVTEIVEVVEQPFVPVTITL